jgi:hypothetical protein
MIQPTSGIHPEAVKGLQAFNQREFYDAHEYFEDAWRISPLEEREIYRALLQLSGGFYRLTQDRPAAARKFFDRALIWLRPFPASFKSLDVEDLRARLKALLLALEKDLPSAEIATQHFHPIKLPPEVKL